MADIHAIWQKAYEDTARELRTYTLALNSELDDLQQHADELAELGQLDERERQRIDDRRGEIAQLLRLTARQWAAADAEYEALFVGGIKHRVVRVRSPFRGDEIRTPARVAADPDI